MESETLALMGKILDYGMSIALLVGLNIFQYRRHLNQEKDTKALRENNQNGGSQGRQHPENDESVSAPRPTFFFEARQSGNRRKKSRRKTGAMNILKRLFEDITQKHQKERDRQQRIDLEEKTQALEDAENLFDTTISTMIGANKLK